MEEVLYSSVVKSWRGACVESPFTTQIHHSGHIQNSLTDRKQFFMFHGQLIVVLFTISDKSCVNKSDIIPKI